jgi:NAD(P)-dependent dehydrogenase (short-subunit alcohol dehydrogenase family)
MLSGKVIIVTGASRGIGAVAARLFAAEGAKVVLGARSAEPLEAVAAGIRDDGGDAIAVPADLSTASGVEELLDAALTRHGRLDGSYLNAAMAYAGKATLVDLTEQMWDDVHDLSLAGSG